MGKLHNKISMLETRRQLRNNPTSAEEALWEYLRKGQLEGRKFRRQHSIGSYVVDFYCAEEDLVVELDGAHHYTAKGITEDSNRDFSLAELGIKVVRFENRLVFENIQAVLNKIRQHFILS